MKKYLGSLLLLLFLTLAGYRIYQNIILKQNLTGYLKRAGDANSVELASAQLQTALSYIEQKNLTSGYTSVIYKTPDEDLEFWYSNLKASKAELDKTTNSSSLEKTNVLLKLRETLLDDGKKGSSITYPEGLSVFPNNKLIAILFLISLLFVPFLSSELIKYDKVQKEKMKVKKLETDV